MRRVSWIALLAMVSCSLLSAATPIVVMTPSFDYQTDYLAEMAEDLEARGHQLYFVGGSWSASAYNALQPDLHNYQLVDFDALSGLEYDGLLFAGAGWYDATYLNQMQGQAMPGYVNVSFGAIGHAIDIGLPIVGIGSGVYPLIFSGLLPGGTQVAAYDCPDLYGSAQKQGLTPIVAKGDPPAGSQQYGANAEVVVTQAFDSWIGTASVPDSWYDEDQGSDLWTHYGSTIADVLGLFSDAVSASAATRATSP